MRCRAKLPSKSLVAFAVCLVALHLVDRRLLAEELDASKLPPAAVGKVDFLGSIQALLKKNCHSCHGAEVQEGGLRLDQKKRALEGGDSGAAIVPGNSAKSRLLFLVAGLDDESGLMPPEGKGVPLTKEEIGLLRAWIDQGAVWPAEAEAAGATSHWAFRPIERPQAPVVENREWPRNPIDAFVLARLEREGLTPSPEAAKEILCRRLYLDLLGLPPTPAEAAQFLADDRPEAYELLVERLLASPRFGERWGRHWLDLARYADSDGYEKDNPRPFAWRYRDWVIEALNRDLPFDRFSTEQLAGDLLEESTHSAKIASGFHRNTLHNTEGGIDPEEDRVKKTVDRTNTLGVIWLGLTVGCAQCHSHKYDPLSQREYYSLYSFFNSLSEVNLDISTPEQAARLARVKEEFTAEQARLAALITAYEQEKLPAAQDAWEEMAAQDGAAAKNLPAEVRAILAKARSERTPDEQRKLAEHYKTIDPELAKLKKAVADHAKKAPTVGPDALAQTVAQLAQPRETRIQIRGDFLNPGDVVQPATPATLHPLVPRGERPDRIDLSRWLFDPSNPLTARVAVNRFWQQLFGRGLAPTTDDFGKQGDPPSHPELLDWLASEFRETGWRQKDLIRLLVTSATYRQSSAVRTELAEIDPENQFLARQSRQRVEAEVIRDLALAAAGLLDHRVGGPSVRPPQPAEYSNVTYANSAKWQVSAGADRYRRGLYTFFQRTSPYPMLMTFDAPDSNECTARRSRSNTPIQALTLWNDPAMFEAAQALARRVLHEAPGESPRVRASYAFEVCLGRGPTAAEFTALEQLIGEQLTLCERDPAAAMVISGSAPLPPGETPATVAAWTILARTLLNLDEFVMRE